MAINIPTYCLSTATVGTLQPLTPDADWEGGMNQGGSNAPGVGINTGNPGPKLDDWTLLDQAGAARNPQTSQHLGGNGLGDGSDTAVVNLLANQGQGADINDTLSFVQTIAQVAPGGDLGGGTINRTGQTVESGVNCWGTNTVA